MYILLADTSNIFYGVKKHFRRSTLDYKKYIECIETYIGNYLGVKIAYGDQNYYAALPFINILHSFGFVTNFEEKANWEVNMAITVMDMLKNLTGVIIGSNNRNLLPLALMLKQRGIRVIIWASNIPSIYKENFECIEIQNNLLVANKVECNDANTTEQVELPTDSVCDGVSNDVQPTN